MANNAARKGLALSLSVDEALPFYLRGDPIRLRVLDALTRGELCVCDLLEILEIAPNLLSYHLRILREVGLVEATRRGRWIDYRLDPNVRPLVQGALPPGLAGSGDRDRYSLTD